MVLPNNAMAAQRLLPAKARIQRSHLGTVKLDLGKALSAEAIRRKTTMAPTLNVGKRHRGDSNPCGQSPMDFESISLTARTQCR